MSQNEFDREHQPELVSTKEAIKGASEAAKEAGEVAQKAQNATKFVLWASGVMILLLAFGTLILNRVDGNTDRNANATERLDDSVEELEASVEDISRVTAQVEESFQTTPEEDARNQAITNAVNEVPEIKSILCEAFPEASACQQPGG